MFLVEIIVPRDVAQIDVRLLLAFDALMLELSVTRAADRVGLTQQGLSGQLARLRTLFSDPLFVRDAAGVAPTPRAEALYPRVQAVLANLQGLADAPRFDPRALEGVVSLAASDYATALLLPSLMRRLRAEAPKLRLAVRPVNSATLEAEMRDRKIDLALTVPEFTPPGLRARRIFGERYVGVVRPDHPLAAGPVDLDGFCAFPHLLVSPNKGDFFGPTDTALAAVGRRRDIALVVPSFSVVAALLDASDLVAVLPERLLAQTRRRLHAFETPVAVEGFELHALWPERLNADTMHRWFRGLAFETFQSS